MGIYDREKLYEEVWKEPALIVAKRYGISGVALGKTCRRLGVPLPPRGYWARIRAGRRVPPQPLLPPYEKTAGTQTTRRLKYGEFFRKKFAVSYALDFYAHARRDEKRFSGVRLDQNYRVHLSSFNSTKNLPSSTAPKTFTGAYPKSTRAFPPMTRAVGALGL